jgi:hypothetical protein
MPAIFRMKQIIVGVYPCGLDEIQLVLRDGTGGEFYFSPEKAHIPRIKVGADYGSDWRSVVGVLLHEIFEMQMTRSHCRLEPAPDYGRDHASYMFLMTHPMFSDVCARSGEFMSACLPDLATAWNQWGKPPRKKFRPTKNKK